MNKLSLYIFLVLMWCNIAFGKISNYQMAGAKLNISILEIMTADQVAENVLGTDQRDENYFHIKYVLSLIHI